MPSFSRHAAAISVILSFSTLASSPAETLLINAEVYGHPQADSIAIAQGKIIAIGKQQQLQRFIDAQTEKIDLHQAYVMPGFIDNHNHVFEAASEVGGDCELNANADLSQNLRQLKQCKRHNSGNSWLIGYGFSIDALLAEAGQQTPLQALDQIFPNRPVILMEQTSHSMWVNSQALKLAGITQHSPEPQGGKYLKDPITGELNGILLDNAGDLVMERAWNSMNDKFERSYQGLMSGLAEAAAHGITTIGDGRLYWKRGWYEVWKEAQQNGDLTARVSLRPWIYPTDSMETQLAYLKGIQSQDREQLLIVDQVKMYSDGILVNGTAKLLAPYLQSYLSDAPYGLNYIAPQAMPQWLSALSAIGYGAHIHAIGDGAVRESLNAIEQIRQQNSTRAYTLTHVELVDQKDIPRFKKLNVTADFQVGSDYVAYHDHQWAEAFLGLKRTKALMNLNALFTSGANVTLSSDWNVHDINPLVGIANSLTMGNTGLPNINHAIEAYTINAAKSLGLDDITGSIRVGKYADLVILSDNITQLPIDEIKRSEILMTFLQGELVYSQKGE
ncbi:urease [Vibrio vulnificus]|uniref:amidohydrolase n=1 Tax=Vibrio vulnificus TaxID=672 RepID=UPI0005054A4B|nr:amidohydrolase [Vibrio vulnificus]KFK51092.1 urease [Vibrio vulnificus]HDY8226767.1 amidohydrolase [Vibrio vulnificus]